MASEGSKTNILLTQGAEGRVFLSTLVGKLCIIKERFKKAYRHPTLDTKLTKQRIVQETRNMTRLSKEGLNAPAVYFVDTVENKIYMEYIANSVMVKDFLRSLNDNYEDPLTFQIVEEIGKTLAQMHDLGIVHGDLTTSNMLLKIPDDEFQEISRSNLQTYVDQNRVTEVINKIKSEGSIASSMMRVYLIDFGLSSCSTMSEDKGVDLYVLERAFLSTHPGSEAVWKRLLAAYEATSKGSAEVIAKFQEVRRRGRKRLAFG
mmetsp:Transcript_10263/g.11148  ORF Transcript_10263/g.11148 Transcript_10263/m.11148 type:complete len:261 (+) Transcript_10263:31-813(+)